MQHHSFFKKLTPLYYIVVKMNELLTYITPKWSTSSTSWIETVDLNADIVTHRKPSLKTNIHFSIRKQKECHNKL